MKKICLMIFVGALVISSCKKNEPEPTAPTAPSAPTAQTATMPVYITDVALNTYFNGNQPMVRFTESGTTNEVTVLVNTCSNTNGNTFIVTNGKSYNVTFGMFIGGTWAQTLGSGTMTIASDGQISGIVGAGNEVGVTKASSYSGCGTIIQGNIILFY